MGPIAESVEVQPYSVEIPQAELEDLEARLARVRWPNELQGVDWS
jgi:epoxide hydrolase